MSLTLPLAQQSLQAFMEVDLLTAEGRQEEARELLTGMRMNPTLEPARLLRLANTYAPCAGSAADPSRDYRRLGHLNQVFLRAGFSPLVMPRPDLPLTLDNIAGLAATLPPASGRAKVSVVMPAHNASQVIGRALDSLLAQTWPELEILVVDDASVDETADTVAAVARRDPRVRLIRRAANGGAYAARNTGLAEASGDYVTVHDADDWSHPQKIEALAERLSASPTPVAALVHHVRASPELCFTVPTVRPRAELVAANRSSLMFRREVFDVVGVWDEVRGGADSELLRRVETHYGADRVEWLLPEVPLSFSLVASTSLTGASVTGFASMWQAAGARRQYASSYDNWHSSESFESDLPYVPGRGRPFPVPALLQLDRSRYQDHVDVVMMSDFALPGGTTASNMQEVLAQGRAGLTTALLHHRPIERDHSLPLNRKLESLVDGEHVRRLSNGESVSCDLLVARFPRSFEHLMDELPEVKTKQLVVIVNQLPKRLYGDDDEPDTYDIRRCHEGLERRFGVAPTWYPLSPVVRESLLEHHAEELAEVTLGAEDWVNVIDVEQWRRAGRSASAGVVRVGRHARDVPEKWPETVEALMQSYPDRADYRIEVLGGADVPTAMLGELPDNWTVHPFDGLTAREFLEGLDVYVYQTHSRWVEAFGRSPLEALAVGVPVVTSRVFEPIFGEAALYAEPAEVAATVDRLVGDDQLYRRQVERGHAVVEERFSHESHLRRLHRLGVNVAV